MFNGTNVHSFVDAMHAHMVIISVHIEKKKSVTKHLAPGFTSKIDVTIFHVVYIVAPSKNNGGAMVFVKYVRVCA